MGLGGSTADKLLGGWDVAYSSTIKTINGEIIAQKSSPTKLDHSTKLGHIKGTFDHWQILEHDGAKGKKISVNVPLHVEKLTLHTAHGDKDFNDMDYVFEVDVVLAFSVAETLSSGAKKHHLKTQAPDPKDGSNSSVQVGVQGTDLIQNYAGVVLEDWLRANIQKFGHVFAATYTDLTDKNPVFSKLLPQALSYAIATPSGAIVGGQKQKKRPGVFTVLCKIDKTLDGTETSTSDLSLVPDGAEAGIAVGSHVFLEHLLEPRMVDVMKLKKPAKFDMVHAEHTTLTNTSEMVFPDFDLSKIAGWSGGQNGVDPKLKPGCFEIQINGTTLILNMIDLTFCDSTGDNRFVLNYQPHFTATMTKAGHLTLNEPVKTKVDASVSLTKAGQDYQIWANAAIQVVVNLVVIILALIPGAEPGAAAVEGAAEATVETEEVIAEESIIDGSEDAAAESSAEAGLLSNATKEGIKNFAKIFAKRLGLGLAIGLSTRVVGDLPTVLAYLRNKTANPTPTLHDLANTAMTANLWNGQKQGKATCTSVRFNDGLVMGLTFEKKT